MHGSLNYGVCPQIRHFRVLMEKPVGRLPVVGSKGWFGVPVETDGGQEGSAGVLRETVCRPTGHGDIHGP